MTQIMTNIRDLCYVINQKMQNNELFYVHYVVGSFNTFNINDVTGLVDPILQNTHTYIIH